MACAAVERALATLKAEAAAGAPTPEAERDVSVLWGAYFTLPRRSCLASATSHPANLLACDDLPLAADCEADVARARAIFAQICPGLPFLPSAEDEEGGEGEDRENEQDQANTAAPAVEVA